MGGIVSAYTEAHFAAALLECGPHKPTCEECRATTTASTQHCPNSMAYHDAVYKYFLRLFPEFRPDGHTANWQLFWQEYQAWVEA